MITTITSNTSKNINTVIMNKINTTSAVLSFSINIGNESTKYRDEFRKTESLLKAWKINSMIGIWPGDFGRSSVTSSCPVPPQS